MHWRVMLRALSGAAHVQYGRMAQGGALEKAVVRSREDNRGPAFWGHSLFSQNGEDGVLAAIFDRIGVGPRKFVEFGFGPLQNNALAFALRHKAAGLYLDGSERNCEVARGMFRLLLRPEIDVVCAWLDRDNIDSLIAKHFGGQEIDLLSVDVDGNDYWMWQAITSVDARVVITEYNASFGPERAVTVPYDPAFDRHQKHSSGLYHGLSLAAAARLGNEKGYALIGCDDAGVNAFFVRRDLLRQGLSEQPVKTAYRPHRGRVARGLSAEQQAEVVYSLPVIDV